MIRFLLLDEALMKVVAYFRRDPDPATAEGELAVQRREVRRWIEDEGGALVAEFTEEETGGRTRPAFGRARKAAQAENAVLLVATTKAIGEAKRFSPYSSGKPRIVCLRDPQEQERKAWSRSRLLVFYRRITKEIDEAQRIFSGLESNALKAAILPSFHTVLAEFVEVEPLHAGNERPALEAALILCRQKRARLIIGTTDAIGGGEPFEPAFTDVPFEVAYRAADRWDDFIPAPESTAGMPISLHFGDHQVRNRRPVYLVNRTGMVLSGITVTRSGWTLDYDGLTQMNPSMTEISWIDDGLGWLVGSYELAFDSDFAVSWRVTAKGAEDRRWTGGVSLDKGGPLRRPLPLANWQAAATPDAS